MGKGGLNLNRNDLRKKIISKLRELNGAMIEQICVYFSFAKKTIQKLLFDLYRDGLVRIEKRHLNFKGAGKNFYFVNSGVF